jgi:hypothetical protein
VDYSTATQDSLPDGWPAFPGGAAYPLGPNERFQIFSSSFPKLHLAHPFHSIEISYLPNEGIRRIAAGLLHIISGHKSLGQHGTCMTVSGSFNQSVDFLKARTYIQPHG